jgi:hypothetical protein
MQTKMNGKLADGTRIWHLLSVLLLTAIFVGSVVLTPQQTLAQEEESEESEDTSSFVARGKIDSIIYTVSGNWDATGDWILTVSDGELRTFSTDMNWRNETASHTHEFRNFEAEGDGIELGADRSVFIEGNMDVGANRMTSWPGVPSEIVIDRGKIITVSLDHEETDNHFGGQSIHGTVTSLQPCDITPGPDMQMPTGC